MPRPNAAFIPPIDRPDALALPPFTQRIPPTSVRLASNHSPGRDMQFPVKTHYAILAMLTMGENFDAEQLTTARAISRQQQIPAQFLGQILQQLRSNGLINSVRGSSGGFRLARPPAEISIAEVVESVCAWSSCTTSSAPGASPLATCVTALWQDLELQQRDLLRQVSLGDLLLRAERQDAEMFYI